MYVLLMTRLVIKAGVKVEHVHLCWVAGDTV